jgi:hypothetical protein
VVKAEVAEKSGVGWKEEGEGVSERKGSRKRNWERKRNR